MTNNRDKVRDQTETQRIMSLIHPGTPNWLGHTGAAASVDYALLHGATIDQLRSFRDTAEEHMRHLEAEHGLQVVCEDGVYRFSEKQSSQDG